MAYPISKKKAENMVIEANGKKVFCVFIWKNKRWRFLMFSFCKLKTAHWMNVYTLEGTIQIKNTHFYSDM